MSSNGRMVLRFNCSRLAIFFWSKLFFSRASTDRKQEALFQEVKILFLNGRSNIRNAHLKIDIHSWCIVAGLTVTLKNHIISSNGGSDEGSSKNTIHHLGYLKMGTDNYVADYFGPYILFACFACFVILDSPGHEMHDKKTYVVRILLLQLVAEN